jgi:hypothetical protein
MVYLKSRGRGTNSAARLAHFKGYVINLHIDKTAAVQSAARRRGKMRLKFVPRVAASCTEFVRNLAGQYRTTNGG